jgi:mono/diheme cytochrome c family protein
MKKFVAALLLLPLLPLTYSVATAQNAQGDPAAGKALWEGNTTACRNCHGEQGQGAFGPDLAGRGLNVAQFKKAVQQPWGIMPAFPQYNDQAIANLAAYFGSLPKVQEPGKWRFEAAANMAHGQQIIHNMGCAQCHGPTLNGPRGNLGAVNADFNYFANLVYSHTTEMPKHRQLLGAQGNQVNMGNFSRTRMPESELREVYNWARDDIGFRPALQGQVSANGASYTITVRNNGLEGKGVAAEGLTVRVMIPAGVTVVNAGGANVKMDGGKTVAEWQLARSAPKQQQAYTITLSRAVTREDGFTGEVRWRSPAPKSGPSTDVVNINLPGGAG